MRHKLRPLARRQIKDIYRYTYLTFGEKQADKYMYELDAVFEMIADNPRIGRPYSGETRQLVHGRHIILYRITKTHISIGRIFHGSQRRTD